ncbi:MAG: hypothetical protein NTY08_00630 [Proteobacteria bacterium]|nr:hypothetical protein [Pseudomonadota bacterium]
MAHSQAELFNSIPQSDHLGLFEADHPSYERITELLGYRRRDVAAATGLQVGKIRHDVKMPVELRERLSEWAVILNLIGEYFQDPQKVVLWLQTPNALLGDIAPRDMIRIGRYKKLLKFVQTALRDNER